MENNRRATCDSAAPVLHFQFTGMFNNWGDVFYEPDSFPFDRNTLACPAGPVSLLCGAGDGVSVFCRICDRDHVVYVCS